MKKMNVVFAKKVIEVDAQFAKKASVYGTKEYNELIEVVKAFPGYKVVTKRNCKKHTGLEMITENFIRKYCDVRGNRKFIDNTFAILFGFVFVKRSTRLVLFLY